MSSYTKELKEKMGGGDKEQAKQKAKKLDELNIEKSLPLNDRDPENKQIKKQKEKNLKELKTGGRAMYKSGMRVCKLAKRGKGRAYGKNS